jgi:hypothetical protein
MTGSVSRPTLLKQALPEPELRRAWNEGAAAMVIRQYELKEHYWLRRF